MAKSQKRRTATKKTTVVSKSTSAKPNFLQKVGGFVKKALPVAAKLGGAIPGVGTALKLAESVFNDNEWWQHVPGEEVATNIPYISLDTTVSRLPNNIGTNTPINTPRCAIVEFTSLTNWSKPNSTEEFDSVIMPSDDEFSTYVMPKIRKVVNAVYMRSTSEYKQAFCSSAMIYALWQHYKKLRYLTEKGYSFMPDLFDGGFPILTTANKAYLDAVITQLEEKLRASVALPATLCQYLAWRFGRVFRTNNSAKAGFVIYSPGALYNLSATLAQHQEGVNTIIRQLTVVAQANADIQNAYRSHEQRVIISEETQAHYDAKEFVLRTNLDILGYVSLPLEANSTQLYDIDPDVIIMDSELSNRETFMASTVSTIGKVAGTDVYTVLFPVAEVRYYEYNPVLYRALSDKTGVLSTDAPQRAQKYGYQGANPGSYWFVVAQQGPQFFRITGNSATPTGPINSVAIEQQTNTAAIKALKLLSLAKQMDVYNTEIFVAINNTITSGQATTGLTSYQPIIDLTAVAIDVGYVANSTIANEHKLAMGNLSSDHRNYGGPNALKKELASETDHFITDLGE